MGRRGPGVVNANPGSRVSWADFIIGYGPWAEPIDTGDVPFLPGHNSSYPREVLLDYGDRLESMLEAETVLHLDLGARGHRLLLCAAARRRHVNFSFRGPGCGCRCTTAASSGARGRSVAGAKRPSTARRRR